VAGDKLHYFPAWGGKADSIVQVAYEFDGQRRWEHLPARRIDDGRYEICCIPFFVHGVALGDEVSTSGSQADAVFVEVSRRSGYFVYRLWLEESGEAAVRTLLESLASEVLDAHGCEFEQYSKRFHSIAAPSLSAAEHVVAWLRRKENDGLIDWESGQS
jgi:hypothetical protein